MGRRDLIVEKVFPEVESIQDVSLRRGVVTVWQQLWEESEWEDINDMPTSLDIPACHVPHNRAVIAIALAIANSFERFHDVKVNTDILLAGALLQDASKVVETRPGPDGAAEKTQRGEQFPHAFLGAQLAMQQGLPDVVCDIILNHTPQSARFPQSTEGRILFYADQVDLLAIKADTWHKVLMMSR